jgi:hypothetical protein
MSTIEELIDAAPRIGEGAPLTERDDEGQYGLLCETLTKEFVRLEGEESGMAFTSQRAR